jgi:hypothetical protein
VSVLSAAVQDIWHRVVQLVTNNPSMQQYAARNMVDVLRRGAAHEVRQPVHAAIICACQASALDGYLVAVRCLDLGQSPLLVPALLCLSLPMESYPAYY